MTYEEEKVWRAIKQIPIDQLELNQWRLLDPRQSVPGGLRSNQLLDLLTRGKIAREMLFGRFPGGPPADPTGRYVPPELFRFAAHSVAIRPTAAGLFQRAINGTLNAGGSIVHDSEFDSMFLGFDAEGREARYDYKYAFIDLEVIIRRWPPSPKSEVLQGILLSTVLDAGELQMMPELVRLALVLLSQDVADIPEGLRRLASECKGRVSRGRY